MTDNIVKLDVGGHRFKTSKSTLMKYDTMLSRLVSSEIPITLDEDGYIFIDRDGRWFGLILNFLRDNSVELPQDSYALAQIRKEAHYYGIQALEEMCRTKTYSNSGPFGLPMVYNDEEKQEMIKKNELIVFLCFQFDEADDITCTTRSGVILSEPHQKMHEIFYKEIEIYQEISSDYNHILFAIDFTNEDKQILLESYFHRKLFYSSIKDSARHRSNYCPSLYRMPVSTRGYDPDSTFRQQCLYIVKKLDTFARNLSSPKPICTCENARKTDSISAREEDFTINTDF